MIFEVYRSMQSWYRRSELTLHLVGLAFLPHLATLLYSLLVPNHRPSSLTTIDLSATLVLPHALGDCHLAGALCDWLCVRPDDCHGTLDCVSHHPAQLLRTDLLHGLALRHIDDIFPGLDGICVVLKHAQLGDSFRRYVLQITSDSKLTPSEPLPPLEEIPSRPGRLNPELS